MEETRKQEILSRIGAWLDDWPDGEPLPEGLDPALADGEGAPDLAQLAAAVTASAKEMQIQGRTFKRLEEGLEEHSLAGIHERLAGLEQALGTCRIGLEDIVDLHDRLARCVAEGRSVALRMPFLARWAGARSVLHGILDGFALNLERLTDSLARAGVRVVETDGHPFDPETMRAVDRVPSGGRYAPGTVAETVRGGYMEGDRLLRPAEVRVAR